MTEIPVGEPGVYPGPGARQTETPKFEPDPMGTVQLTVAELLERGGPWEILPGSLARMTRAAETYLADQGRPPAARQRVREVWLQGRYRPAYLGEGSQKVGER